MKTPVYRVSAKFQIRLPKAVCARLGLKAGDFVRYVVDGQCAVIKRVEIEAGIDPFGTFGEWASEADEDAYGSL